MDRRVAILRFWLLCFAALACAWAWPAMGVGLWPVLFLFPSCVCCGAICANCDPSYGGGYQMVITGVADNDATGCSVYNGTFETTRLSSPNECFTNNTDIGDPPVDNPGIFIGCQGAVGARARVATNDQSLGASGFRYSGQIGRSGSTVISASHRFDYETMTKQDCAAFSAFDLPTKVDILTDGLGHFCCDISAADCELTAL